MADVTEKLTVAIVDDEEAARRGIRLLLENESDTEIVAECATGREAVDSILALRPQLVFLDVQMPGLNGFQVLEHILPHYRPAVVFATAYDDFAIRAFDVNAVDYLLKPYTDKRFQEALNRGRESVHGALGGIPANLAALLATVGTADRTPADPGKIVIRIGGRAILIGIDEIHAVSGAGDYMRLHTSEGSHLVRESMNNLAARLAPHGFVRIHRSSLIRLSSLHELRPRRDGLRTAVLRTGIEFTVSRSGRTRLEKALGQTV
ncbi:MAG: LytTR family DNA-binding domain-containing protein [Gemmatimonadota bacterium]